MKNSHKSTGGIFFRRGPGFHSGLRPLALLLVAALLFSCSRTVVRPPLETREFKINWENLDSRKVVVNGMVVEGLVLTPSQWPLEASMKRLFQLDFVGIIRDFDLSFRPASLNSDALRKLYDAGYLPAYLRVTNQGQEPALFNPDLLVLRADGETLMYPALPETLPERFKEIDWLKTGAGVLYAALFIFIVLLAAKEGRSSSGGGLNLAQVTVDVTGQSGGQGAGEFQPAATSPRHEKGLLNRKTLAPGGRSEGFLFFIVDRTVADWRTAQIDVP